MVAFLPVAYASNRSANEFEQLAVWQWVLPIVVWHAARALFGSFMAQVCPRLRHACGRAPLPAKEQAEVTTRAFYALQHSCLSVAGGMLCWRAGWLTGPGFETFYTFPFPHALPEDQSGVVRLFYQLQAGVHIESAYVLLRGVQRKGAKSQRMMLIHHAATLFLVCASWIAGTHEVGSTMFFLHDASDIGIDALKLARAWGATALLQALIYLLALVSWGALRCVYLPLHVLIPGWQMFHAMCFAQDPMIHCYGPRGAGTYGLVALLGMSVLQILHVLWFIELLNKGLRELRGQRGAPLPDMCAPGDVMQQKRA